MGVLQLIASDNFITYSKVIAKKLGVNCAILLGAMCSYQNSFGNQEFFKEQEKISDDTCLSRYEIQQALKVLEKEEIISINKKGLPAKNYYYIFDNKLSKILTTSDKEIKPQEIYNLDNINNNINNNNIIINNKENSNINIRAKETSPNVMELYDYWQSKKIKKHQVLSEKIINIIKQALKTYDIDAIKQAIDRYEEVLHDNDYYFDTVWGLDKFLKQSNALPEFLDDGDKWISYQNKKSKQPKATVKTGGDAIDELLMQELEKEMNEQGEIVI